MNESNAAYEAWLQKALEDEFAGKDILDGRHFAAPACFHFQQMAEKLLKALLVAKGKTFPKSHDLVALAGLLEPLVPKIKGLQSDLEVLNRYYVETRYPADYPEFTFSECAVALEAALRVKEFVLAKLGETKTQGGFGALDILVVLAIFAVLGITGYVGTRYLGFPSNLLPLPELSNVSPPVQPSPMPLDTSDWKTYRNEQYGFEVKYPQYREILGVGEGAYAGGTDFAITITTVGSKFGLDRFIIQIFRSFEVLKGGDERLSVATDLESVVRVMSEIALENATRYHDPSGGEFFKKFTFQNIPAFLSREIGLSDHEYSIFMENNRRIYVIILPSAANDAPPDFGLPETEKQILSTFKFIR